MKRMVAMAVCLCLLAPLAACAQKEQAAATPAAATPAATPVLHTPTPAPPTKEAREERFSLQFQALLAAALAPPLYTPSEDTAGLALQREVWLGAAQAFEATAKAAYEQTCAAYEEEAVGFAFHAPAWKFIAALFHRLGDDAALCFASTAALEVDVQEHGVALVVSMQEVWPVLEALQGELAFGVSLTYTYLNTVYDDAGEETPFVEYPLTEAYLLAMHDPLPGAHIKNGWYNDRDKGARKHTGTDIRSPEDTPILSCTDGTLLYINSNLGAGNYVVVRDDEGFVYHYYHMVRLTTFLQVGERVKAGDVIGHVGNTGNSSANHLHLGIISPEFGYLNPYVVLRDMRKLQKG